MCIDHLLVHQCTKETLSQKKAFKNYCFFRNVSESHAIEKWKSSVYVVLLIQYLLDSMFPDGGLKNNSVNVNLVEVSLFFLASAVKNFQYLWVLIAHKAACLLFQGFNETPIALTGEKIDWVYDAEESGSYQCHATITFRSCVPQVTYSHTMSSNFLNVNMENSCDRTVISLLVFTNFVSCICLF